jgi:hypothetical protein
VQALVASPYVEVSTAGRTRTRTPMGGAAAGGVHAGGPGTAGTGAAGAGAAFPLQLLFKGTPAAAGGGGAAGRQPLGEPAQSQAQAQNRPAAAGAVQAAAPGSSVSGAVAPARPGGPAGPSAAVGHLAGGAGQKGLLPASAAKASRTPAGAMAPGPVPLTGAKAAAPKQADQGWDISPYRFVRVAFFAKPGSQGSAPQPKLPHQPPPWGFHTRTHAPPPTPHPHPPLPVPRPSGDEDEEEDELIASRVGKAAPEWTKVGVGSLA